MKKFIVGALAALALIGTAPVAQAQGFGCERVNWGFLGLTQKRDICDGPRRPDGSWERTRMIFTPAYTKRPTSYCSGGPYYSSCSYDPGGFVPETTQELVSYIVFDYNIPPGEPGWLPPGSMAIH